MKRLIVMAAMCSAMAACGAEPMSKSPSANADVRVEVLTEFDGVRLYRVRDGSDRTVYIAVSASQLRAEWTEQHGKTIVHRDSQTLR